MIYIYHDTDRIDATWYVGDCILGATRDETVSYFIGQAKPNYPMPAIQGHVIITMWSVYLADPKGFDCVACWRLDRGQVI